MRQVMIGTPCYDGKVDCRYADSLAQTIKLSAQHGIEVYPVYMPYDALIQRSRNDLLKIAIETGVDDLIFIDSDQAWRPEWVFRLLSHAADVVGGAVRKKSDAEQYNVRSTKFPIPFDPATSLLLVDGVGTGFLRLSKKAMQTVWAAAPEYRNEGKASRMAFDVRVIDGQLYSEDTVFCESLKDLGFQIHVDPSITCSHVGAKMWSGEFSSYVRRLSAAEQ